MSAVMSSFNWILLHCFTCRWGSKKSKDCACQCDWKAKWRNGVILHRNYYGESVMVCLFVCLFANNKQIVSEINCAPTINQHRERNQSILAKESRSSEWSPTNRLMGHVNETATRTNVQCVSKEDADGGWTGVRHFNARSTREPPPSPPHHTDDMHVLSHLWRRSCSNGWYLHLQCLKSGNWIAFLLALRAAHCDASLLSGLIDWTLS